MQACRLLSFLICISILIGWSALEAAPLCQSYYKNPGYSNFLAASDEMIEDLSKTKDVQEQQHAFDTTSIFIAHVMRQNPEQLTQMLEGFSGFSFYKKAAYLRAMQAAGIKEHRLEKDFEKELEERAYSPPPLSLSALNPFVFKEGNQIDFLWVSFFATGHKTYIHQILENLNKDKRLLALAWNVFSKHLNNAQGGEDSYLNDFIQTTLSLSEDDRPQFLIVSNALFSLTSHAKQDSSIYEIIEEITQENESLNFLKNAQS